MPAKQRQIHALILACLLALGILSIIHIANVNTLNVPKPSPVAAANPANNPATSTPAETPGSSAAATLNSAPTPKGLHFAPGPDDGPQVALTAADRFANAGGKVDVGPALPVYNFPSGSHASLETAATNDRFIYYVVADGVQVAAVTVVFDRATGSSRMASAAVQPRVDTALALHQLAKLPRVLAGSFEARILNIQVQAGAGNSNSFPVIWLKPDSLADTDLLYTVQTYYQSGVQPNTLYKVDDLLNELTPRRAPPGSVNGIVLNSKGNPAPNAQVTLTDAQAAILASTTTDATGSFSLEKIPSGVPYQLSATLDNQASPAQSIQVRNGSPLSISAPIQMQAGSTIAGTVLTSEGKPAANVTLRYVQIPDLITAGPTARIGVDGNVIQQTLAGTTTADGTFQLKAILPGQYLLTAVLDPANGAPRQIGFIAPVAVSLGNDTQLAAPIRLTPCGSISGKVLGNDGSPAAGVGIAYSGTWNSTPGTDPINLNAIYQSTRTDTDGAFTLKNVPPGTYKVTASNRTITSGAAASVAPVEVKENADTKLPDPLRLSIAPNGRAGG